MRRHQPKRFGGSLSLLTTDAQTARFGERLGWDPFIGGTIDVVPVPGLHRQLLHPENEATTAAALDACFRTLSAPDTAGPPGEVRARCPGG
jgi:hypothetical protein